MYRVFVTNRLALAFRRGFARRRILVRHLSSSTARKMPARFKWSLTQIAGNRGDDEREEVF